MGKFSLPIHVDLGDLDPSWAGAFVDIAEPGYGAIGGLADLQGTKAEQAFQVLEFLEKHFIRGKAPEGGQLVDMQATDVKELPVSAIERITDKLLRDGAVDPKSSATSTSPSTEDQQAAQPTTG